MSAGIVLTAGVATIRRTSSSKTIHDVEEGSASDGFSKLAEPIRERLSSEKFRSGWEFWGFW